MQKKSKVLFFELNRILNFAVETYKQFKHTTMSEKEKRIAAFIDSLPLTPNEAGTQSIVLSTNLNELGDGENGGDCINMLQEQCYLSTNKGNCKNYSGFCGQATNKKTCFNGPSGKIETSTPQTGTKG